MSERWHVARIKPRQEAVALLCLSQQGFDTYSPRVIIERMRAKRISIEREPFFPGYVLVKFVVGDAASWRLINSTRGIAALISFSENGVPTPLPKGVVESIQRREITGDLFHSEVTYIRRGDTVRLKFGPALDKEGKVLFTRGERIELLLDLLGRQVRVKAPLHAVEIVEQQRNMRTRR